MRWRKPCGSPAPGRPVGKPKLTVIVPIRNEATFVESCLKSILDDAPAGGLEVLVVDGMSDDGTDRHFAECRQQE